MHRQESFAGPGFAGLLPAAGLAVLLGLGSPHAASAQVLRGMVFDEMDGAPLSGATVRLLDESLTVRDSTVTDVLGRFRFRLAAEGVFSVAAEAPGFATAVSPPVEVAADQEYGPLMVGVQRLATALQIRERWKDEMEALGGAPTREEPVEEGGVEAAVLGRVVEHGTGNPIEGAAVRFEPGLLVTLTGPNGVFWFDKVPPGIYRIRVERIGFETLEKDFLAERGRAYDIRAELSTEPVEIEGLTVTAHGRTWYRNMQGFQYRMGNNSRGIYFTREDMERRGNPKVSQMLRGIPGIRVRERPGSATVIVRDCFGGSPSLWIDGVQVKGPLNVNMVPGTDIEAIELYRGVGSVPPEFSTSDSVCGALVIWTRRGPGR